MIMCGELNWSILVLFNSIVLTARCISVEWRTKITMNEGKNFYEGGRGLFERMKSTTKILSTDGNLHDIETEHKPRTLQFAWRTAGVLPFDPAPHYVQIPKRSSLADVHKLTLIVQPFR
jgi:hypothetical protein